MSFSLEGQSAGRRSVRKNKSQEIERRLSILAFLIAGILVSFFSATPVYTSDSASYLPIAGEGLFSHVNLAGNAMRPWVVTLPYGILHNYQLIVIMQISFSLLSWSCLIWSLDSMNVQSLVVKRILRVVVILIALSSLVIAWNPLLLSDSMEMSSVALLIFGYLLFRQHRVAGCLVFLFASFVAGQIRSAMAIPIALMALLLSVTVLRDWWRLRRRGNWRCLLVLVILITSMVGLVYNSWLNVRIDAYWGAHATKTTTTDIRGRTLQQLGDIASTPWGKEAVTTVIDANDLHCLDAQFRAGTWWPTWIAVCPSDAKTLSHVFPSQYAAWILEHPSLVARSLLGPFNDSFAIRPAPGNLTLTPDPISGLWSTGGTGSNPVVLGFLAGLGALAWLFWNRSRRFLAVLEYEGIVASALLAVLATATWSPMSNVRVGSGPAMLARIFVIFTVMTIFDEAIERRRRAVLPGSAPTPSFVNQG